MMAGMVTHTVVDELPLTTLYLTTFGWPVTVVRFDETDTGVLVDSVMAVLTSAELAGPPLVAAIATASREIDRADSVAVDFLELVITWVNAGTARAARIPRTTIATTSSSRVKALRVRFSIMRGLLIVDSERVSDLFSLAQIPLGFELPTT